MTHDTKTIDYRGKKTLIVVSWFSLVTYVLFKLSNYPISKFHPEVVFILTFFGSILFRPLQLKLDIALRLMALSICLPLIFFAINYLSDPISATQYFYFEKLVKLMLFSAIGFWLGGKLKNIYIFLLIIFTGLLVALFNVDIIPAFRDIFSGKRVDFDIQNAQHAAMFFGLAIIGFLSFYKELLFFLEHKKSKYQIMILFNAALLLALIVFIGTQTRAGILGMNFIFILSILHFIYFFKKYKVQKNVLYLFYIYALLSFVILSTTTFNIMSKRGFEEGVTTELSDGNLDNIPMSSLGIRINSWMEAGKWIKQKPLHGWGGKVRQQVIQHSDFPENIKNTIGHFHNSYIEFAVAYGLIGLLFMLSIYIWINRQVYLLSKENKDYHGIWLFTLYGSLYLMVINIFESYVFFRTGAYATAFLLAPGYSLYLSKLYSQNQDKSHL